MVKPKVKDLKIIFNSNKTNNICFNLDDYCSLRNNWESFSLESNTRRYDLKRGLFGNIRDINIWVNKDVPKGHVKIYPKDKTPQVSNDPEWSINIEICKFEKILKLKAFW